MLAHDLALALDPAMMARTAGLEPDPWQAAVMRATAPRMLLNCCRQSGKSTTAAVVAVHQTLYVPGSLTILLSPSLRQSQESFRKCLDVYRALDRPVPAESENKLTLELENGSRIVSLPGKEATIRGYSGVSLLIVDEAARVPDDLYRSVRPMLAVSGGRLLALSTPWGKRGWWFEAWTDGGAGWERVLTTALECPRITPEFLREERRTLGELWYNQEYCGKFEDLVSQLFPTDLVLAAASDELAPLFVEASRDSAAGADEALEALFALEVRP